MRSAKPPEGAWYGRGPDRYVTHGAAVEHRDGGWFAAAGRRMRGPLSSLPAAFDAAEKMLAEIVSAPVTSGVSDAG